MTFTQKESHVLWFINMHLSPNNNHLPPVWAQPKKIPHKHPHGRNSAHPIDITPNNSSKARGIQPENLLKKVLPFPLKHKANSTLRNSSNKNPNDRVWKPKKNPSFLITRKYKTHSLSFTICHFSPLKFQLYSMQFSVYYPLNCTVNLHKIDAVLHFN